EARATMAARDGRLHRDPIADVDAPALGGAVADALDHAERLVAGNHRILDRDGAGVLLGVAAADATRLDAQERAVVGDVGHRQLAQLELARSGLDDGTGGTRVHDRGPLSATPATPGRRRPTSTRCSLLGTSTSGNSPLRPRRKALLLQRKRWTTL